MIKVYGIKTCGSVRNAIKFLNDAGKEHEFIDLKKENISKDQILKWLEKTDLKTLFNSRGTKYRTLGLKELNLDDEGKIEWLEKENLLIKRPVIENGDQLIVGFDEELYKESF
jgi:arsenate reductase